MHITVAGAARSGIAAARLAKRLGHTVAVTSLAPPSPTDADELARLGIPLRVGPHTNADFEADLLVLSPGIPPTSPIRQGALHHTVESIGELEFAWRHCNNPVIGITGTNGKTTTTMLTTHILNASGRTAVAVGNVGTPLSDVVDTLTSDTIVVAEVSSYQLDTCTSFAPRVACILNITPDHLAYHGTFEQYVHAKWKICQYQNSTDTVILNVDEPHAAGAASVARGNVVFISAGTQQQGACIRDGQLVIAAGSPHKEEFFMPVKRLGLPGLHNMYNSMAAAVAARAFEVSNDDLRHSLESFSGVEHRLEPVRTLNGIRYVNDSKATNINAAWYALSSYDRPIVWIAGGRGDANDYTALDDVVAQHVRAIVCIGEEGPAIFNHWCTSKRCVQAASLAEAVATATSLAEADDVVLFSPACKSFDMFDNFEHRGEAFKHVVTDME